MRGNFKERTEKQSNGTECLGKQKHDPEVLVTGAGGKQQRGRVRVRTESNTLLEVQK